MSEAIAFSGQHRLDFYQLGRIANAHEYVTPRGGTLLVPMWAVTQSIDAGARFGGYLLRECRYIGTVGRKVDESSTPNLFTNEGVSGVAKMLIDSSAAYDTGIKRVEIGTGGGSAVTPTVDDVALVGGAVRFACNAPTESAGVITVVTPISAILGNIYIREIGVYIANDTGTISAGDLLSHAAENRDNATSPADITNTYTISLARLTSE